MAWELIAETLLGAPAASVTFAAIPQTYRVLALVSDVRTDAVAEVDSFFWRANADAGNNYDVAGFYASPAFHGHWGARATPAPRAGIAEAVNSRANCFGPNIAFWLDYSSATAEKHCLAPGMGTAGDRSADADLYFQDAASWWRNIAAITQLVFAPDVGPNFVAGSRFTLYGVT